MIHRDRKTLERLADGILANRAAPEARCWVGPTANGKRLPKRVNKASAIKSKGATAASATRRARPDPLRVDPTRLAGPRRQLAEDLLARYTELRGRVVAYLLGPDGLELANNVTAGSRESWIGGPGDAGGNADVGDLADALGRHGAVRGDVPGGAAGPGRRRPAGVHGEGGAHPAGGAEGDAPRQGGLANNGLAGWLGSFFSRCERDSMGRCKPADTDQMILAASRDVKFSKRRVADRAARIDKLPNDNVWYRHGSDHGAELTFKTSAGTRFNVSMVAGDAYQGRPVVECMFADNGDDFTITGKGGGPAVVREIFNKVSAALVSYARRNPTTMLKFSAAEPSRKRFYDRLVKAVGLVLPGHSVVTTESSAKGKVYHLVQRDLLPDLLKTLGHGRKTGPGKPEIVVNLAGTMGQVWSWVFLDASWATTNASSADIDRAASRADPAPTEAQIESGNYKKGHVRLHGLDIAIETAAGNKRKPWHEQPVAYHYGYVKARCGPSGCVQKSDADGDHVDVFLGPHPESERVFVVDQVKVPTYNSFCPTGKGGGIDPTCPGRSKRPFQGPPPKGKYETEAQADYDTLGLDSFSTLPTSLREGMNRFFFSNEKVNHFARTGTHLPRTQKAKTEETVALMRKAFEEEAYEFQGPVDLWRGSNHGDSLKVGDSYVDNGFPSTAIKRDNAEAFRRGGNLFNIKVHAGIKYLPGQLMQREVILPPGLRFKVTKVEPLGDTGKKLISLEVEQQTVNISPQYGAIFDEHKCLLGWCTLADARRAYLANYPKGWQGLGAITSLTMDQFKRWLVEGDTSKPIAGQDLGPTGNAFCPTGEGGGIKNDCSPKVGETVPAGYTVPELEQSGTHPIPKDKWTEDQKAMHLESIRVSVPGTGPLDTRATKKVAEKLVAMLAEKFGVTKPEVGEFTGGGMKGYYRAAGKYLLLRSLTKPGVLMEEKTAKIMLNKSKAARLMPTLKTVAEEFGHHLDKLRYNGTAEPPFHKAKALAVIKEAITADSSLIHNESSLDGCEESWLTIDRLEVREAGAVRVRSQIVANCTTVPDVRQTTGWSCGAAALASVVHHWADRGATTGVPLDEETVGRILGQMGTDPVAGTGQRDFDRAARRLGLRSAKLDDLDLATLEGWLARGIPVIAAVDTDSGSGQGWDSHWVVVTGLDGEAVTIMDPLSGHAAWSLDRWLAVSRREGAAVYPEGDSWEKGWVGNSNPDGCNQYTGPDCKSEDHSSTDVTFADAAAIDRGMGSPLTSGPPNNCYMNALNEYQAQIRAGKDATYVIGEVGGTAKKPAPGDPVDRSPFTHAWVEVGGKIIDPTNLRRAGLARGSSREVPAKDAWKRVTYRSMSKTKPPLQTPTRTGGVGNAAKDDPRDEGGGRSILASGIPTANVDPVERFQSWFDAQVTAVFGAYDFAQAHAVHAYTAGMLRTFDELTPPATDPEGATLTAGARMQFLAQMARFEPSPTANEREQSRAVQPSPADRARAAGGRFVSPRALALARALEGRLKDCNRDMAEGVAQALRVSIRAGETPHRISLEVGQAIQAGYGRARTVADGGLTGAHAAGQLDAMEALGVGRVAPRACPGCRALDGVTFGLADARGLLPSRGGCRCAWSPISRMPTGNAFDPSEDRDDHGRWQSGGGSGGGTAEVPQPPLPGARKAEVLARLHGAVDNAKGLPPATRDLYRQTLAAVVDRLPHKALKALSRNLDEVHLFPDGKSCTLALRKLDPGWSKNNPALPGRDVTVCGSYDPKTQTLLLDGVEGWSAKWIGEGEHKWTVAGVHAHEITHVIDGPNKVHSKEIGWQRAWGAEIINGQHATPITAYAKTKPEEGLAEFGRLVYGGGHDLAKVEARFPHCTAFFKSKGLWPKEEHTSPVGNAEGDSMTRAPWMTTGSDDPDDPECCRLPELFDPAVDNSSGVLADALIQDERVDNTEHDPVTGRFVGGGEELASEGWHLTDDHKHWLATGEVELVHVPNADLHFRPTETRESANESKVAAIARGWKVGKTHPVVEAVRRRDGTFRVMDGRHRAAAHLERDGGPPTIPLIVPTAKFGRVANAFCPGKGAKDNSCSSAGGGGTHDDEILSSEGAYGERIPTAYGNITVRAVRQGKDSGWFGPKAGSWEVSFTGEDNSYRASGKHGAGAVGVTRRIGAVIDRFLKDKAPERFHFSGNRWKASRVRLYDKAAEVLAARHGYSVKRTGGLEFITYAFTKIPGAVTGNAALVPWDVAWGSAVANAFCPTGEGGGRDDSCPPHGSGGPPAGGHEWTTKYLEHLRSDPYMLMEMLGAPDDATATVGPVQDGQEHDGPSHGGLEFQVRVKHPKLKNCSFYVGVDRDGKKFAYVNMLVIHKEHMGEGLGTQMVAGMVKGLSAAGFSHIDLHAAGDARSPVFNGYYTWPRLGWDQPVKTLLAPTRNKVRVAFPYAKSVLDLFKTREGREWWKEHGSDMMEARFDLSPGSRSRRVFDDYIKDRKGA